MNRRERNWQRQRGRSPDFHHQDEGYGEHVRTRSYSPFERNREGFRRTPDRFDRDVERTLERFDEGFEDEMRKYDWNDSGFPQSPSHMDETYQRRSPETNDDRFRHAHDIHTDEFQRDRSHKNPDRFNRRRKGYHRGSDRFEKTYENRSPNRVENRHEGYHGDHRNYEGPERFDRNSPSRHSMGYDDHIREGLHDRDPGDFGGPYDGRSPERFRDFRCPRDGLSPERGARDSFRRNTEEIDSNFRDGRTPGEFDRNSLPYDRENPERREDIPYDHENPERCEPIPYDCENPERRENIPYDHENPEFVDHRNPNDSCQKVSRGGWTTRLYSDREDMTSEMDVRPRTPTRLYSDRDEGDNVISVRPQTPPRQSWGGSSGRRSQERFEGDRTTMETLNIEFDGYDNCSRDEKHYEDIRDWRDDHDRYDNPNLSERHSEIRDCREYEDSRSRNDERPAEYYEHRIIPQIPERYVEFDNDDVRNPPLDSTLEPRPDRHIEPDRRRWSRSPNRFRNDRPVSKSPARSRRHQSIKEDRYQEKRHVDMHVANRLYKKATDETSNVHENNRLFRGRRSEEKERNMPQKRSNNVRNTRDLVESTSLRNDSPLHGRERSLEISLAYDDLSSRRAGQECRESLSPARSQRSQRSSHSNRARSTERKVEMDHGLVIATVKNTSLDDGNSETENFEEERKRGRDWKSREASLRHRSIQVEKRGTSKMRSRSRSPLRSVRSKDGRAVSTGIMVDHQSKAHQRGWESRSPRRPKEMGKRQSNYHSKQSTSRKSDEEIKCTGNKEKGDKHTGSDHKGDKQRIENLFAGLNVVKQVGLGSQTAQWSNQKETISNIKHVPISASAVPNKTTEQPTQSTGIQHTSIYSDTRKIFAASRVPISHQQIHSQNITQNQPLNAGTQNLPKSQNIAAVHQNMPLSQQLNTGAQIRPKNPNIGHINAGISTNLPNIANVNAMTALGVAGQQSTVGVGQRSVLGTGQQNVLGTGQQNVVGVRQPPSQMLINQQQLLPTQNILPVRAPCGVVQPTLNLQQNMINMAQQSLQVQQQNFRNSVPNAQPVQVPFCPTLPPMSSSTFVNVPHFAVPQNVGQPLGNQGQMTRATNIPSQRPTIGNMARNFNTQVRFQNQNSAVIPNSIPCTKPQTSVVMTTIAASMVTNRGSLLLNKSNITSTITTPTCSVVIEKLPLKYGLGNTPPNPLSKTQLALNDHKQIEEAKRARVKEAEVAIKQLRDKINQQRAADLQIKLKERKVETPIGLGSKAQDPGKKDAKMQGPQNDNSKMQGPQKGNSKMQGPQKGNNKMQGPGKKDSTCSVPQKKDSGIKGHQKKGSDSQGPKGIGSSSHRVGKQDNNSSGPQKKALSSHNNTQRNDSGTAINSRGHRKNTVEKSKANDGKTKIKSNLINAGVETTGSKQIKNVDSKKTSTSQLKKSDVSDVTMAKTNTGNVSNVTPKGKAKTGPDVTPQENIVSYVPSQENKLKEKNKLIDKNDTSSKAKEYELVNKSDDSSAKAKEYELVNKSDDSSAKAMDIKEVIKQSYLQEVGSKAKVINSDGKGSESREITFPDKQRHTDKTIKSDGHTIDLTETEGQANDISETKSDTTSFESQATDITEAKLDTNSPELQETDITEAKLDTNSPEVQETDITENKLDAKSVKLQATDNSNTKLDTTLSEGQATDVCTISQETKSERELSEFNTELCNDSMALDEDEDFLVIDEDMDDFVVISDCDEDNDQNDNDIDTVKESTLENNAGDITLQSSSDSSNVQGTGNSSHKGEEASNENKDSQKFDVKVTIASNENVDKSKQEVAKASNDMDKSKQELAKASNDMDKSKQEVAKASNGNVDKSKQEVAKASNDMDKSNQEVAKGMDKSNQEVAKDMDKSNQEVAKASNDMDKNNEDVAKASNVNMATNEQGVALGNNRTMEKSKKDVAKSSNKNMDKSNEYIAIPSNESMETNEEGIHVAKPEGLDICNINNESRLPHQNEDSQRDTTISAEIISIKTITDSTDPNETTLQETSSVTGPTCSSQGESSMAQEVSKSSVEASITSQVKSLNFNNTVTSSVSTALPESGQVNSNDGTLSTEVTSDGLYQIKLNMSTDSTVSSESLKGNNSVSISTGGDLSVIEDNIPSKENIGKNDIDASLLAEKKLSSDVNTGSNDKKATAKGNKKSPSTSPIEGERSSKGKVTIGNTSAKKLSGWCLSGKTFVRKQPIPVVCKAEKKDDSQELTVAINTEPDNVVGYREVRKEGKSKQNQAEVPQVLIKSEPIETNGSDLYAKQSDPDRADIDKEASNSEEHDNTDVSEESTETCRIKRTSTCPLPDCLFTTMRLKRHAYSVHLPWIIKENKWWKHFNRCGYILRKLTEWILGETGTPEELCSLLNDSGLMPKNVEILDSNYENLRKLCKSQNWPEKDSYSLQPINSPACFIHWRAFLLLLIYIPETKRQRLRKMGLSTTTYDGNDIASVGEPSESDPSTGSINSSMAANSANKSQSNTNASSSIQFDRNAATERAQKNKANLSLCGQLSKPVDDRGVNSTKKFIDKALVSGGKNAGKVVKEGNMTQSTNQSSKTGVSTGNNINTKKSVPKYRKDEPQSSAPNQSKASLPVPKGKKTGSPKPSAPNQSETSSPVPKDENSKSPGTNQSMSTMKQAVAGASKQQGQELSTKKQAAKRTAEIAGLGGDVQKAKTNPPLAVNENKSATEKAESMKHFKIPLLVNKTTNSIGNKGKFDKKNQIPTLIGRKPVLEPRKPDVELHYQTVKETKTSQNIKEGDKPKQNADLDKTKEKIIDLTKEDNKQNDSMSRSESKERHSNSNDRGRRNARSPESGRRSLRKSLSPRCNRRLPRRSLSPDRDKRRKLRRSYSPDWDRRPVRRSMSPESTRRQYRGSFSPEHNRMGRRISVSPIRGDFRPFMYRRSFSPDHDRWRGRRESWSPDRSMRGSQQNRVSRSPDHDPSSWRRRGADSRIKSRSYRERARSRSRSQESDLDTLVIRPHLQTSQTTGKKRKLDYSLMQEFTIKKSKNEKACESVLEHSINATLNELQKSDQGKSSSPKKSEPKPIDRSVPLMKMPSKGNLETSMWSTLEQLKKSTLSDAMKKSLEESMKSALEEMYRNKVEEMKKAATYIATARGIPTSTPNESTKNVPISTSSVSNVNYPQSTGSVGNTSLASSGLDLKGQPCKPPVDYMAVVKKRIPDMALEDTRNKRMDERKVASASSSYDKEMGRSNKSIKERDGSRGQRSPAPKEEDKRRAELEASMKNALEEFCTLLDSSSSKMTKSGTASSEATRGALWELGNYTPSPTKSRISDSTPKKFGVVNYEISDDDDSDTDASPHGYKHGSVKRSSDVDQRRYMTDWGHQSSWLQQNVRDVPKSGVTQAKDSSVSTGSLQPGLQVYKDPVTNTWKLSFGRKEKEHSLRQGGYPGQGYGPPPGGQPGYPAAGGQPGYPAAGGYGGQGAPPGIDPNVYQWFLTVDQDKSGHITAHELQQALVNGNWSHFNPETCRLMISLFDRDNTGTIQLHEFQALWNYIQQWKGVFERFDGNRSGSIEAHELMQAYQQMGYNLSPQFGHIVIAKFDVHGRRSLTLDNFIQSCVMLKSLTDSFKQRDPQMMGNIRMSYEDFMTTAVFNKV